ncbi:MAG: VOC family protein [Parvibaculum sp.]|nr:VOC family protein [Parvibaculum sp.]|tara:strand:+ start:471 stop:1349 length:879 start_codon:yes stop_codon:yes gene_type:complete
MSIASLGYIGFEVSDIGTWQSYMENFLGLMRGAEGNGCEAYRMDDRAARIFLLHGERDDVAVLGLEVQTATALETVKANLEKKKIAYTQGDAALKIRRHVVDLICLQDPAGLDVEIYYGATELTNQPFNSPAGVSRFCTGDQGAGHVVLASPDMDRIRAFYVEALGFSLSDTIGMKLGPDFSITLEFYHCNQRHHTLALAGMPASRRLHHFMVEMATLDDVGFALDRIGACGVRQKTTLGKHTNDQMISFYAETPSGFDVEVGYAGIPVHDESWRVTHHEAASMWGHKPVST